MTPEFWRAVGIRALKTFFQTAVALLPAMAAIQEVDWLTVLSSSLFAAVLSACTSIATGLPEVPLDE